MSYCHQSIHDQKSYTDWALKKLLTFFLVKIFFKLPPPFQNFWIRPWNYQVAEGELLYSSAQGHRKHMS